jgi:hypothetical protein
MSSPALKPSPAPGAPPVPPSAPARWPALRRRRSHRKALAAGLLISLILHGLAVLLSRHLITVAVPYRDGGAPASPTGPTAPPGLRVYELRTVAEGAAPSEEVARDRPEEAPVPASTPGAQAEAAPRGEATDAPAGRVLSPAERLRPRDLGDHRLWAPLPLVVEKPVSPAEAATEHLARRLGELNDSLALEADAARRAMDWTIKGKDGKRWGISPEGIHLGGITLPAPSLGPKSQRERDWEEIQDQADRARIRDRFDERARELRERKDRERQERKQDPQGSSRQSDPPQETKPPSG